MRRIALLLAALAVAAALAAAPGAGAATPCPNANSRPDSITLKQARAATRCLLNRIRVKNGLTALSGNSLLLQAANGHSQDMVDHHYFSHYDRYGNTQHNSTYRVRQTGYLDGASSWYVAENIYWGTLDKSTPQAAVNWWMNSEGHRHNILLPQVREIGIGIARGVPQQGSPSGATYTTDFAFRQP